MRPVALLLVVLSAALAVAAAGGGPAATATPSIRVTFSGTASGRFNDVERWVLLSSNECYLRRLRDQKTSLSWNLSFSGGRSLAIDGSCDGEGGRERHRGARLVRRRGRGASARRTGRLAAQPELQRSTARHARGSGNVVERRSAGARPDVAVGKKAVCTAAGAAVRS